MGTIIKNSMVDAESGTYRLLIYCNAPPNIKDNAVSINKLLAEKLLQLKPTRRTLKIEECFNNIIAELPEKTFINGVDVMFNPKYKIDVLRILIEANKRHPFSLVWPGTFDGSKLVYSEEALLDYKTFEISDYDIVCVV